MCPPLGAETAGFRAQAVEHLVGRAARAGQGLGGDAPDPRDVLAGRGVVDPPVARQLIGLLAVLAAALAVALAGQGPEARGGAPGEAEGEGHVGEGQRVAHAPRLLLGAAGGQHHGRACAPQGLRRAHEVGLRHARETLDPLRPVARGERAHRLESLGAIPQELPVDELVAHEHVQEAVGQGGVRAGAEPQVQVGHLGGGRPSRIDHDERAARLALGLEVAHERGHRLRRVGPHEEDGLGVGNVREREGQSAVDPEGPGCGGRRGRHAEAAVVVDARGAEGEAGELAQEVRLLVGEAAAPQDADRVLAMALLDGAYGPRHAGEGLVPGRGLETTLLAADQGSEEPIGVGQELPGGPALDTEGALVDREVGVPIQGDRFGRPGEDDAALQRAVGTMGLHGCH
jgi:hypothetical protein